MLPVLGYPNPRAISDCLGVVLTGELDGDVDNHVGTTSVRPRTVLVSSLLLVLLVLLVLLLLLLPLLLLLQRAKTKTVTQDCTSVVVG